jgi:hypothetical protein
MHALEPGELQSALYLLGYTQDLADEAIFASPVEVARGAWPQWRPAA